MSLSGRCCRLGIFAWGGDTFLFLYSNRVTKHIMVAGSTIREIHRVYGFLSFELPLYFLLTVVELFVSLCVLWWVLKWFSSLVELVPQNGSMESGEFLWFAGCSLRLVERASSLQLNFKVSSRVLFLFGCKRLKGFAAENRLECCYILLLFYFIFGFNL